MPDKEQVARGKRMREARLKAAVRETRTLSQASMAELLSKKLKRTVYQTQWSNYELGLSDPPYDVVAATAELSGLSAAYIAFGVDELEIIDPSRDRRLTDDGPESDRARAERAVAREREERAGRGKRRA